ncbi:SDR family NAD(P)-dependent oxidoreductase [Bacillus sinesaloumensis]|uniref:SDR family NAD(P)-dependent oxidoreductase n=1 Tax=Litchfieldia sinesaloumensis TaxID=1926280 RepID=UPI0009887841|nr:glucose 1-dehydrogenase [Bacillus sinesaloumensis]
MGKLAGKVSIVTGGSRGIGRGICLEMAKEGSTVVINYLSHSSEAESLLQEVKSLGGNGIIVKADVSEKDQIDGLIKQVIEHYGRIDILVNNAGICPFRNFFDIDLETWDKTINVNLRGIFLCSQAAANYMVDKKEGSIINISSVTAFKGGPKQVHYAASKGGVDSLTTSMANALGEYGIRVNAILCGGIPTDINKWMFDEKELMDEKNQLSPNRVGKPEDIGKAVVYLSSNDSSWVTGALIPVDGGTFVK